MYENKKILVCGIARSGISVSNLLLKHGASVTLYDKKNINFNDDAIKTLLQKEVDFIYGEAPINSINLYDVIVVSPGIPLHLGFILKAYELEIPVISEIEVCSTLTNKTIVGITGTNGKTTCTTLIGEVLKANGDNAEIVGNIGIPFSERLQFEKDNTIYVAELSSYQLESTYSLKPNVSVVINLSRDHIERHKTYENYIKAKKRIYMNQSEEDFLVLNFDDEICKEMAKETNAKVVFFSKKEQLNEGVFVKNNDIYIKNNHSEVLVLSLSKIKLLGEHNIENILATVSALSCLNVDINTMRKVIYDFSGIEHRVEIVRKVSGVTYVNDSKSTNESSTISAVNSFAENIILILGGYGKQPISHELYKLLEEKVKRVLLIGESKEVLAKLFTEKGYTSFDILNNFDDIASICDNICCEDDIVLFSPGYKSLDMFKNYEERGNKFKEIIKNLGA